MRIYILHRPIHRVARCQSWIIGGERHIGVVDDLAVSVVFALWRPAMARQLQEGAVLQQLEVAVAEVRCPLRCLFLVRRHDKEHEVWVGLPQGIDTFSSVEADPAVRDDGKACHALLSQFHNLLSQRELEILAPTVLLVETPRKAHRVLPNDGAGKVLLFHIRHILSSVSVSDMGIISP